MSHENKEKMSVEEFHARRALDKDSPVKRKPGLSMFNDKYDTVAVVPLAALAASAGGQAQKTPDSE